MPSPVGHTLLGIAFAESTPIRLAENRWVEFTLVALLANLPDLDFLPGYLLGQPLLFHRHEFHSLAAALAAGVLTALVYRTLGKRALPYLVLGTALFASHLLLDTTTAPGTPLLWPILDGYVQTPWTPFLPIEKVTTRAGFFGSLLTTHNAAVAAWETLLLLPVAVLGSFLRKPRRKRAAVPPSVAVRQGE